MLCRGVCSRWLAAQLAATGGQPAPAATQLAGARYLVLVELLQAGLGKQQEAAEEAAAAEQQGDDQLRTPKQRLSRRLGFHLLRTLAALCSVPIQLLLQPVLRIPVRRQVLCGRTLSFWCERLEEQALVSLLHSEWWQGALDHVLCLALASLPQRLPEVMSMINLRVISM